MRIGILAAGLSLVLVGSVGGVRAEDGQLFGRIDANSDGQISSNEIQAEGKPLYARLLRIADRDRNGKLSREEFDAGLKPGGEKFEMTQGAMAGGGAMNGRPGADMLQNAQAALANIDRDKNGKISESEAPPRLKQRFKELDKDGDGELDRREMGAAMMQLRPGAGEGKKAEKPKK